MARFELPHFDDAYWASRCNYSKVLIKGTFFESTRKGLPVLSSTHRKVPRCTLALTPHNLLIENTPEDLKTSQALCSSQLFFLKDIKLTVFKKSRRQCLKICFWNQETKYFDLDYSDKKKVKFFWELWCRHVVELNEKLTKDPLFLKSDLQYFTECIDMKRRRWTDKYIYLGIERDNEDRNRPQPIPGLGAVCDTQLFYLKPKYFGCWDQSEHWVQCCYSSCLSN